jgi:hypothetical protein
MRYGQNTSTRGSQPTHYEVNDMTKEKAKRIHAAEQQRAMYQHNQRVLGKGHKGGINEILVPDETREDGWRPIFDQEEITQRLIERN